MKKHTPVFPLRGLLWLLAFFVSCQSIQKDLIFTTADASTEADISSLEDAVIRLEGRAGGRDAGFNRDLSEARRKAAELERRSIQDTGFTARLAAWSGRLYLLEGKTGDAGKELAESRRLDPGNVQALILAALLEPDLEKRLVMIDGALDLDPSAGELLIERGRILFALDRYRESVAAFDTAFSRLSRPIYQETYRAVRNQAWELRDMGGLESSTAEIIRRPDLSWQNAIDLTKNETGLLRFLTAGRDWPTGDLFARLADRSFIPLSQDITLTSWPAQAKPLLNEQVTRAGAAWFLWHLLAENRADRGLLSRYSSRYANRPNAASPIPDLPLTSPYFDSILGCIEREIMALPDGRNFIPNEPVRGTAFLAMLRKL
jgi:tetratricopeptide (TPR) repeat protein